MRVWRREPGIFIFYSAEPKWHPLSSWKNNEAGTVAHHFGSGRLLVIRQERSLARPRPIALVSSRTRRRCPIAPPIPPGERSQAECVCGKAWATRQKYWWDAVPTMVGKPAAWPRRNNFTCGALSASCACVWTRQRKRNVEKYSNYQAGFNCEGSLFQ